MNEVCILDTAIECALGSSLSEVWPRLCRGESAIGPIHDFDTDELHYHSAACVSGLKAGSKPNRICTLMHAALDQLCRIPDGTAVIWAGVKGNVEHVQALAGDSIPPAIHHPRDYRKWVCQTIGIENRGMEVNAACASSTVALALGREMIARGECTHVLVCAADIVSRFTFTGFASLKALSPTTCRPFDVHRDGLCLGEGAAAVLLADPKVVSGRADTPLVRLTGWGISNDANHITGPARDGRGLTDAIRQALQTADVSPPDIAAWCMHGTGTVYNDAMELTAMEDVFPARRFPIFSIKGAIGHTLGAAGVLETAICAKALQEHIVPPTAELLEPEPRAVGRALSECQELTGNRILTTNSGFGGVNAAIILEVSNGS